MHVTLVFSKICNFYVYIFRVCLVWEELFSWKISKFLTSFLVEYLISKQKIIIKFLRIFICNLAKHFRSRSGSWKRWMGGYNEFRMLLMEFVFPIYIMEPFSSIFKKLVFVKKIFFKYFSQSNIKNWKVFFSFQTQPK